MYGVYSRATLWALLDHSHCLPSSSAPRRSLLALPWLCCLSLGLYERGQWPLHQSRYWHIIRFNPFGKSEARKHLSAWLLIMLPHPRDLVVISLLHGLGCLSPSEHRSMMAGAAAVAWLLPFEWPAGTPEIEKSGTPLQVGIADPLLLKSLKQAYQNCESITTSSLERPSVIWR